MRDIVRIGRGQLAEHGAAALSLRAIARELGVVSSAIYRYVADRDALLTLLVVDGYDELGDAVDAALADEAGGSREQFLVLGRAVRAWALAEPATYALLFGSPVPGYAAPAEQTVAPGTRVPAAMLAIAADAYAAGALVPSVEGDVHPTRALGEGLDGIREQFEIELPDAVLTRGVLAWASLFGCISFELFGQYGPDGLGDPAALFEHHLACLAEQLGLA